MPDLKDRQDRLNPSQADFDNIISTPDMQAVNDRGDAIARDLKGAETTTPNKTANSSNKVSKNLTDHDNGTIDNPENKFNYQSSSTAPVKGLKGWSRKRKATAAGIVGGGLGSLLMAIFVLLPMKVPGIMSLVTQETGQRLEQMTERRAKQILGRAILTKFGSHTKLVVTGEGAFSTLMATMRTAGFEKKLAAKGLVITETPDGVKLAQNGKPLGGGQPLKNEKAILEALDGNKLTNKMIKDIVKEEIPTWRWIKRAKFAKWLRYTYNIPKYGLDNSDEADSEEKKKAVNLERTKRANARLSASYSGLLTCIMSGSCDNINGTNEPSKKAAEASESTADIEAAITESEESVASGERASATKLLVSKFATQAGSKLIPFIGWIDIIATLDHFANETVGENDFFGKVAAAYKGAAYAAIYADWAGYGSQMQLGAMDPEIAGVLADDLNESEKAQFIQAVQGNPTKGVPIEVMVNSDKPSPVKELYDNIINSPIGFGNKYIGHPILNAYYETVGGGGLLGWLSGAIGNGLSPLTDLLGSVIGALTPQMVKDQLTATISALAPVILKTFGMTIDAMATGAELMNNIFAGGVVSMNAYAESIGAGELNQSETYIQNQSVDQERAEYLKQKGLAYALFSNEEPTSLTSQLAMAIPTTTTGAIFNLGSVITSVPSKLMGVISPNSFAAGTTYEAILGVKPFGATPEQLDAPLTEQFVKGEDCLEFPEGTYNACRVENETAGAMLCKFEPENGDCAEDNGDSDLTLGGEAQFRAATYNIRTPVQTDGPNLPMADGTVRFPLAAKIISENNIDVIGVQETENSVFGLFKQKMSGYGYDNFPKSYSEGPDLAGLLPVYWKIDTFEFVDGGFFKTSWRLCPGIEYCTKATWVKLKYRESGREIYFMNDHMVNENAYRGPGASDAGGAAKREATAISILETMKTFTEGVPVFVVGDMNSSWELTDDDRTMQPRPDRNRIPYCIFTADNMLANTKDILNNRNGKCPSQQSPEYPYEIDHIYASPTVGVTKWRQIKNISTNIASDHDPIIADIAIDGEGTEGGGSIGEWSWPVDKKWWNTNRDDFLGEHPTYSGTFTDPYKLGIGVDIGDPPDGSPVYSMLAGKVIENSTCVIIIESNTPQGKLQIAYGHGINRKVDTGDSVTSGQQIMGIGAVGCQVRGGHVHMDMALNGKHICPQDVFLSMGEGKAPDLLALIAKGISPCDRL